MPKDKHIALDVTGGINILTPRWAMAASALGALIANNPLKIATDVVPAANSGIFLPRSLFLTADTFSGAPTAKSLFLNNAFYRSHRDAHAAYWVAG